MNYFVATFNGFGDGVMCMPLFKDLEVKSPESKLYYTENLFLRDQNIKKELDANNRYLATTNDWRSFKPQYWQKIGDFFVQEDIKRVVSFRNLGFEYDRHYFEFKSQCQGVEFFDVEDINRDQRVHQNARTLYTQILSNALGQNVVYNSLYLNEVYGVSEGRDKVMVSIHTGAAFKAWSYSKWSQVVKSLTQEGLRITVYEGFTHSEHDATKALLETIPVKNKLDIELVRPISFRDMITVLQGVKLLVSPDSGPVHLADSLGVKTLGIYLSISPYVWGGITNGFNFIESPHMRTCPNHSLLVGSCLNKYQKCPSIANDNDDISVNEVVDKILEITNE